MNLFNNKKCFFAQFELVIIYILSYMNNTFNDHYSSNLWLHLLCIYLYINILLNIYNYLN